MESAEQSLEKQNRLIKKKLIPWHCQQRYQTSLSQISLNHTINKACYNRKIKSLLNNNKNLAKALERSRNALSDKENVQQNNTKNIDLINYSSRKLKEILDSLKLVTSCVNETFEVLQSHITTNPPKNFYCPSVAKNNFKKQIRAISKAVSEVPLAEVAEENEQSFEDNKDPVMCIKQTIENNISKAKKSVPAANKKDTLTVKKSKRPSFKGQIAISPQKIAVRTHKPYVDDTPPSYLLGISSDNESFRNLIDQSKKASKLNTMKKNSASKGQLKELDKNSAFIQSSKKKSKKVTGEKAKSNHNKSAPCKKAKVTTNQFVRDSLSPIEENSIKSIKKSSSPSLETNLKVWTIRNATNCHPIMPKTKTDETSANVVQKDLQGDTAFGNLKVVLEKKDFMQRGTCFEKQTISSNEIFDESNELPQSSLPLKSNVKARSSCQKKVGFLLEEDDEIQMLCETQPPITKPKVKRISKRPLKESSQNVPRKKQARSASASEDIELKKKNSFIVTAEVHQPLDGYKKRPTIDNIHLLNMQPYVVLTDIFKDKNKPLEISYYLTNQVEESPSAQMIEKEDIEVINSESLSYECDVPANCNKENKIDDQNLSEARKQSRRLSKVSSYKEMKLNVKMRRC